MAVFQSKYRELSFYVNGEKYSFSNGSFSTDDGRLIAVLENLRDAQRVDTKEPEVTKENVDDTKPTPRSRKAASAK
ncbi:hypothetical protein [Paenibacillus sp. Marseille-Q9583]